jgi:hypothetical protein
MIAIANALLRFAFALAAAAASMSSGGCAATGA